MAQDRNRAGVASVGGRTVLASDSFSRPANATAYAANDRVSATISDTGTTPLRALAVGRVDEGSGYITSARLWTNNVTAMTPRIRVHLFTVAAPATALLLRPPSMPLAARVASSVPFLNFEESAISSVMI